MQKRGNQKYREKPEIRNGVDVESKLFFYIHPSCESVDAWLWFLLAYSVITEYAFILYSTSGSDVLQS